MGNGGDVVSRDLYIGKGTEYYHFCPLNTDLLTARTSSNAMFNIIAACR